MTVASNLKLFNRTTETSSPSVIINQLNETRNISFGDRNSVEQQQTLQRLNCFHMPIWFDLRDYMPPTKIIMPQSRSISNDSLNSSEF